MNLKIFIDTQEQLRYKRRIERDLKERGYDLNEILYYLTYHVTPGYLTYVKPHKHKADFVIPNNKDFNKALEVIITYLRSSDR